MVKHIGQTGQIFQLFQAGFVQELPDITVTPGENFVIFSAPFDEAGKNIGDRGSVDDVRCSDTGELLKLVV